MLGGEVSLAVMIVRSWKNGLLLAALAVSVLGCDVSVDIGGPPTPGSGPSPSPPGAMLLELSPLEPTSSDELSVVITQPAVDPDGDITSIRFTWWVDGIIQAGLTDLATITAEQTSRGELWQVRAYAIDSVGQVGPESGAQVTIGNSPPSTPQVQIRPEDPAPGLHTLVCEIVEPATDEDDDDLTYSFAWSLDGEAYPESSEDWTGPITDEHEGDSIPPEDTVPAQHWMCSVRAHDGVVEGDAGVAVVTVGETPVQPDFALPDINETSPSFGTEVSPRDYLKKVSGWYFGHAT